MMALRDLLRRRSSTPVRADAGLRDAALAGWRNPDTDELLTGFGAPIGSTVLDIGCGDQPHSVFFANRNVDLILADLLPDAVAGAADRARAAGMWHSVRELVTDSDPLPLPDASCDRIIATEVIEHVPDERAFLGELVRVGRPDALYLLSVPDRRSEDLQRDFAAPGYFSEPNHVRVFGEGEFEALVESCGLEIVHRQYDGFFQTLIWAFFWVSGQPTLGPPYTPLIDAWKTTWHLMLDCEQGPALKQALDDVLPKSVVIVARKAAE